MMVDTHVHVVSEDRQRYPLQPTGLTLSWVEAMPVTTESLLQRLEEAHVERAVLVQAISAYGYDNRYTAESAQRHADRCTSVCIIDPVAPGAADTLEQWVRERGMWGVRLFTATEPEATWLDDEATFPVWQRAGALGIPVCVQMRAHQIPRLRRVVERFPEVSVALDHLAGPRLEEGSSTPPPELLDLARYPNLHLKFSTVNLDALARARANTEDFFRRLIDAFGVRRLMWGSNYPATYDRPYGEMAELARRTFAFLSEDEREWLLGETALSLWPELRKGLP
ncbi:MAG: amidohydrolase [Chloroflexi bacterium]|nr:amidohydrolase [Chloroflexota bacterium]